VEASLSKVITPMPNAPATKAPTTKATKETDADFEARITKVANRLVGNYN
jgi:hypothetical protein